MRLWAYHLPELAILLTLLLFHLLLGRWVVRSAVPRISRASKYAVWMAVSLSFVWVLFGLVFGIPRIAHALPSSWWLSWLRGTALTWAIVTACVFLVAAAMRRVPAFSPSRRGFVRAAGAALAAAPVAAAGFAVFVQRHNFRLREVDIPIPGLPEDLEGLRLVQISDIHLSPFLSEKEFARAVALANEARPHVALVTGDLITSPGDPLDGCLRQLAALRAEAGVFGCCGNHERYCGAEAHAARQGARLGIRFLRGGSVRLSFGSASLNFAGVDHQPFDRPYLRGAERLIVPGSLNVLLSHNPDVFPVAAEKGYDVTLSGHTHGGQINMEILSQDLNVARFYTPYTYGLYRRGKAVAYVTRGVGTVGIPARLGAPPEVAVLRLCAA